MSKALVATSGISKRPLNLRGHVHLPGWVLGKKKRKEKDYQMVSLLNLATKLDRERHILGNLARAPHVTLVSQAAWKVGLRPFVP